MRNRIVDFLSSDSYKPMKYRELIRALKIKKHEKKQFTKNLNRLIKANEIVKTKKGKYVLSHREVLLRGFIRRDSRGLFLDTKQGALPLKKTRRLGSAAVGDEVVVTLKRKGNRQYITITDIVSKNKKLLIGFLKQTRNGWRIKPLEDPTIYIPVTDVPNNISNGALVAAKAEEKIHVVKVYQTTDNADTDREIVIDRFALPHTFSSEVANELKEMKEPTESDILNRTDFRNVPIVTIDGEDAKDFDDGVFVSKENGGYTLQVHIADVSYYVKRGSFIDREALKRGFSVYFPGSVIPMLPFELSNNICSLVPQRDRLSLSVVMKISNRGKIQEYAFVRGVVKNRHRLTYRFVEDVLKGRKKAQQELENQLKLMAELALVLRKRRLSRGSIDLEIPEASFEMEDGRVKAVKPKERLFSHTIIEEFMLAANLSAADLLKKHGGKFIKRIHDAPDPEKIKVVMDFLESYGYSVPKTDTYTSKVIMKTLSGIKDNKMRNIVSMLILRAMKRAEYSTKDTIHFALNFKNYTHFTSPIRRYSDLVTHRLILSAMEERAESLDLDEIAYLIRDRELVTEQAEFYMDDIKALSLLEKKVGEVMDGFITSVTRNGLFVRLKDVFAEGYVDLSSLDDDYYDVSERMFTVIGRKTKRILRVGDDVKVRIEHVDRYAVRLDLSIVRDQKWT